MLEKKIGRSWLPKKIKDIAPLQRGFDLPNSQLIPGPYPVVYSNGIENFHAEFKAKAPGVVTGRSGTIGKFAYVSEDYWPHNTSLWVTDFKGNDPLFVFYLYNTINIARFGTGSGVPTLNRNDVHDFVVEVPPTKAEQTAIATALSNTDALIQSLEKLIAKKRAIKQGAMQELLTGKRRLPGFEGKWVKKMLGECLKVKHGKSQHEVADSNGVYPILATSGIVGKSKQYLYDRPSVLIGRKGTIDAPQYMETPFWTIDTLFYTEIFDDTDAKFIFYRFKLIDWYSYNEASGVPSLNARTIENIELFVPPTKMEQVSISALLSEMDREISAHESKLSKYRTIKQGMMQELLTGKTRLV
jgi:type I restriction enzyme S subunit